MSKNDDTNNAEIKRFYLQQKSVRRECDYGAKNCTTCSKQDCKIRQFVEVK